MSDKTTPRRRYVSEMVSSGMSYVLSLASDARARWPMTLKKKSRVLAIDDEPAMIEWLKILLEHEGYEVRTAMIGTRGEEIFKTWKPDVVVTDMMLPDADGLELLRKFKQIHGDTEVIVI